jgi:hypothetical protein
MALLLFEGQGWALNYVEQLRKQQKKMKKLALLKWLSRLRISVSSRLSLAKVAEQV